MPIDSTIRLSGGPLKNKTVATGAVEIGQLLRLTRPSGALAFYRITQLEQVPNRTSFTGSATFEPKGDGRKV